LNIALTNAVLYQFSDWMNHKADFGGLKDGHIWELNKISKYWSNFFQGCDSAFEDTDYTESFGMMKCTSTDTVLE